MNWKIILLFAFTFLCKSKIYAHTYKFVGNGAAGSDLVADFDNWEDSVGNHPPNDPLLFCTDFQSTHVYDLNGKNVDFAYCFFNYYTRFINTSSTVSTVKNTDLVVVTSTPKFDPTNITFNFNTAGKFRYNGAAGQELIPIDYYDLQINGAGTSDNKVVAQNKSISVANEFDINILLIIKSAVTIQSNSYFANSGGSGHEIQLDGSGTITDNRSTKSFIGTFIHNSSSNVYAFNYTNLTILLASTLSSNTTVSGVLKIGSTSSAARLTTGSNTLTAAVINFQNYTAPRGGVTYSKLNTHSGTLNINISNSDVINLDNKNYCSVSLTPNNNDTNGVNNLIITLGKVNLSTATFRVNGNLTIINGNLFLNSKELQYLGSTISKTGTGSIQSNGTVIGASASSGGSTMNFLGALSADKFISLPSGIFSRDNTSNVLSRLKFNFTQGGSSTITTGLTINNNTSIVESISFSNNTGIQNKIILNDYTLSISGTISGTTGQFSGSSNSAIVLDGLNTSIYLDQTSLGSSTLSSLTLSNGAICSLNSNLTLSTGLNLGSGTLSIGANTLTFSGTSTQPINRTTGSINPSTGTIKFAQTSTNGNNSLIVAAFSNNINNFIIDYTNGGILTPDGSMTIDGNITLNTANSKFALNANTLTVKGTILGTGSFIGSSNSNLICSTATSTIYFDQSSSAAYTLQNLTLANGASCTLGSNLILANGVDLGTSNLTVGSNTLTFAGSSATWITRNGGRINTTGGTIEYAQTSTAGTNHSIELAAYYTSTAGVPLNNFKLNFANACTFTPPSDMTIGGTLNLSGTNNTFVLNGTTLTVAGSVTSTGGKFKGSATSNLNCSGTSSLYFDQTSASTKTLKNLKVQGNNAAVTIASALEITAGTNYGSVEVTAASSTLTTGNNLTLKSDANGTARIANSPGTISGRYYAELYFPAKREYRFISAPVVGATALQWRNNGSTAGSSTSGVGIIISGTNGATDSFDATTSNKPSAFYYDEPSAGSVTNINSTGTDDPGWKAITKGGHYQLTNGKGYRVLIRGDRNVSLTTSNPTASTTTITSYGSYPRTSGSGVTINVTNSATTEMFNGLNLIGNPYPSAIDWNTISRTNVDNGYTVYNFNKGSYDAWNGSTGDAGQYISAGQAVFVWCNNSTTKTGSLTINESDKYDGKGGSYFLEKLTNHLKINLMYDSVYNSNTFLHFRPDALDSRDEFDIPQFLTNGTNIATIDVTGKAYKINSMLNLDSFTSIPLSVAQTPAANLKLSFFDVQSFDGYKLELVDNYKKTKTAITEGLIYNFEITNDSMSQKNGRFYINFTRQAGINTKIIQNTKIAEIYPNPVENKLNIKLDSKYNDCSYVIYNNVGQKINQGNFNKTSEKSIATKNYAKGIYYIVIKSSNTSQTIQFIK